MENNRLQSLENARAATIGRWWHNMLIENTKNSIIQSYDFLVDEELRSVAELSNKIERPLAVPTVLAFLFLFMNIGIGASTNYKLSLPLLYDIDVYSFIKPMTIGILLGFMFVVPRLLSLRRLISTGLGRQKIIEVQKMNEKSSC